MNNGNDVKKSHDLVRQALNVAFAFAQVLTTYLAFYTGTSFDEATATDKGVHPIVPAGYAFIIWSPIYAGSIAYAVYQALPSQRGNEVLRRVGFLTASAFLATTLWLIMARFGSVWLTVVCMLWILASVSGAFIRLVHYDTLRTTAERYLVVMPVSIFFGWVTVATFANTASALKESGWSTIGLSEEGWAAVMLVVAGVVGSFITLWSRGNAWYASTVIWALVGIVVANVSRDQSTLVAAVAGGMASLIALALVFDRAVLRSQFGQSGELPQAQFSVGSRLQPSDDAGT
jgi:benzodiazapine receptor